MAQERGISEIYGEGTDASGAPTPIYRALRTLLCSACGTPIPSGTLFTRKSIPNFSLRILPRCRRCAPFEERAAGLIESLLSPPAEDERRASDEVERRLGPALDRSRRKQKN